MKPHEGKEVIAGAPRPPVEVDPGWRHGLLEIRRLAAESRRRREEQQEASQQVKPGRANDRAEKRTDFNEPASETPIPDAKELT